MIVRRPWCPDCGALLDEGHAIGCATAEALTLLADPEPVDLDHVELLFVPPWTTATPRSEYL